MDYISAKEFLNQPKEVRKVLLDWWQPQIMDLCSEYVEDIDLFTNKTRLYWEKFCILSKRKITQIKNNSKRERFIPLLTEGQLRKFIEDKGFYIDVKIIDTYCNFQVDLKVAINDYELEKINIGDYFINNNLLQVYWKVALKIIKEDILGNGIGTIKEEIK